MSNRVLIFDDNPELLGVLQPLLEMQGYVVEARRLAADTIASLQAGACDVLVLNHDYDETVGGLVQLQLTALGGCHGTHVVAFTSSTDEAALSRLRSLGVDVLTKPLSYDRLLASIRACTHGPISDRHTTSA